MSFGSLLRGFAGSLRASNFELHISLAGSGSGSVTRSPPNLVSEGECKATYIDGSIVSLIAIPDENSIFTGWSEDVQGAELDCSVTMDSPKRVEANFSLIAENEKRIGSFLDNCDGTVTDTRTGLTWTRFSEGQTWSDGVCFGEVKSYRWGPANDQRSKKNYGGFDDWRLPTIEELKSIVKESEKQPSTDTTIFPSTPSFDYWSSSASVGDACWAVNFLDGNVRALSRSTEICVRLVRGGPLLNIDTSGLGFGIVTAVPSLTSYVYGSKVRLTAEARVGSVFIGWSGHGGGSDAQCFVTMNGDKQITAHFEECSFVLHVEVIGTGSGVVSRRFEQPPEVIDNSHGYPAGATLVLTATPAEDSVFVGWSRSASGTETSVTVLIDAEKSVSANFRLKSFELSLSQDGSGSGSVSCVPEGGLHAIGTSVTLTANPNPGSVFSGWSGDVMQNELTCSFVMDSVKAVTAGFSRLSYALDVLKAGSGAGTVTRNLLSENYVYGDTVTLTATAAKGSVFNGWGGAAIGIDATLNLTFDTDKTLIASFEKLNLPTLDITVDFVSAEHASMKSGDDAFILYLSIANQGQKQVRMELPLVSYVTHAKEEIRQDAWLTGLIIGNEGAMLRAGTFRKAGLVFLKSKLNQISAGDQFHVSISQSTRARRFDFSFKCTDSKSRSFTLIDAVVEEIHVPLEIPVSTLDASVILRRLELLETGLSEVLLRLAKLEAAPPELIKNTENIALTVTSLSQVLTWLVTQERVSMAALRGQLLPLDQFPGAFIDEINEQALDLMGDLALEEGGDEIVVAREILAAVIANYK